MTSGYEYVDNEEDPNAQNIVSHRVEYADQDEDGSPETLAPKI